MGGERIYNNICIMCQERWPEGAQDYIMITMCKPCVKAYEPEPNYRNEFSQAEMYIYSKLTDKRKFVKVKALKEYLR